MVKILQPITSTWLDYPNKDDLSLVVVMMGCDNGCPMCQNPQFKNPEYSNETKSYTVEDLLNELTILSKRYKTNKVVLSGGDPLSCFNLEFTKKFLENSNFDVCIYTGHTIDYVKKHNVDKFKFIKCGLYDEKLSQESEKTDNYMKFASKNQKLYDNNYCCISENGIYLF